MSKKIVTFNPKYFFIFIFVLLLFYFVYNNKNLNLNSLSSDLWLNNFVMLQKTEIVWSYIPKVYNAEDLYIAYPLFYYLNTGLNENLNNYIFLSLFILSAIFLINSLVVKKIFNNWILAAFAGVLVVIPRNVFFTSMGFMSLSNLRGNIFSFPFYFLLLYYWTIYGVRSRYQNIFLAIAAGILIYLYPPAGTILIFLFVLTSLIINYKKYFKQIVIFVFIYLLVASPFLVNHFVNPNTKMLDSGVNLSADDLKLQSEIIQDRFSANAFLTSVDIARVKRTIWDSSLLSLLLILTLVLLKKINKELNEDQKLVSYVSFIFMGLMLAFVFLIEILNYIAINSDKPPVFIEHIRLMRIGGFVLIMQSLVFIYYLIKRRKYFLSLVIALLLVFSPIYFSKVYIRSFVRIVVPENIRVKYNLAPVVEAVSYDPGEEMIAAAMWTRQNLSNKDIKFFVFDDEQREFQFKVLSRVETNLTAKEGSIYVTSGFENSKKWYEERKAYKKYVEEVIRFNEIVDYAKTINSTHILIPKGKYLDLFRSYDKDDLLEVYSNAYYKIVEIK